MLTVVETPLFQRQWPLYLTEEERGAFAAYIAERPTAGEVVPESGGIRKVRWGRAGSGKSGGVRIIYSCAPPKANWSCSRCMRRLRLTISPDIN